MEAYRRIQWNVFRLENEVSRSNHTFNMKKILNSLQHLNNCGQYRAIKEIPLPFALTESVKTIPHENEGSIQLPTTTPTAPATPIPINSRPPASVLDPSSWMASLSRQSSTQHSQTARESIYSGSFYGRRDFENRHDHEEVSKEASSMQPQSASVLGNVLTRIRSFGAAVGSDVSDTERDDIDDDDDSEEA